MRSNCQMRPSGTLREQPSSAHDEVLNRRTAQWEPGPDHQRNPGGTLPSYRLVIADNSTAHRTVDLDRLPRLHLTRFGGHLILAESRRKESRYGTSIEVPG